jgi:sugar (pentulose or hexulose) kinase
MAPGETLIIMGTAARVTMIMEEPEFDMRFMNFVSVEPGRWVGLGAINGVGSALRWLRDVLATEEQRQAETTSEDVYDLITAHAAEAPAGAEGLLLLPYLAGERTPIWDPHARGLLFGLTISHQRAHIYRAFLEGPAFSIRQAVEIIAAKEHPPLESITIGGAAAKSELWNLIIASVLGRPLRVLSGTHVEVLGAAVVGGVAAGLFPNLQSGMDRVAQPTIRVEPDGALHQIYSELYPLYVDLYPNVEQLYDRLAQIPLPGRTG